MFCVYKCCFLFCCVSRPIIWMCGMSWWACAHRPQFDRIKYHILRVIYSYGVYARAHVTEEDLELDSLFKIPIWMVIFFSLVLVRLNSSSIKFVKGNHNHQYTQSIHAKRMQKYYILSNNFDESESITTTTTTMKTAKKFPA